MRYVADAEHGQDLIERGCASQVLAAAGALLRIVQAQTPLVQDLLLGTAGVLVHGDFGPQNMLLYKDGTEVAAILDWEYAHLGSSEEDLAWAEWIVRMHHPDSTEDLAALFTGFGHRPNWSTRHEAMITRCSQLLEAVAVAGNAEAEELWRNRMARTHQWSE